MTVVIIKSVKLSHTTVLQVSYVLVLLQEQLVVELTHLGR